MSRRAMQEHIVSQVEERCSRKNCEGTAVWVPHVYMYPAPNWEKEPAVGAISIGICDGCRAWFLETSAPLVTQFEDLAIRGGARIDRRESKVVLLKISDIRKG